jgi:hypothetical protein
MSSLTNNDGESSDVFYDVMMNFIIKKFMEWPVLVRFLVYKSINQRRDEPLQDLALQALSDYTNVAHADEFRQFVDQCAPGITYEYSQKPELAEMWDKKIFNHFLCNIRIEEYTAETSPGGPNGFAREPVIDPIPLKPREAGERD